MRAADDFEAIARALREIKGTPAPDPKLTNPEFCPNCGTDLAHGMPHASSCPKAPQPDWDPYCA